jgi:hypothetical protein
MNSGILGEYATTAPIDVITSTMMKSRPSSLPSLTRQSIPLRP